jgi:rubrerythrin
MSNTENNLSAAFAGESQANRKYLAFAKAAEKEGKKGVAKLFKVAAAGETVHALSHFEALGGIKDTTENLKTAIAGETYEIETMYPQFMEAAKVEGESKGLASFTRAEKVEEVHQTLFQDALAKLEAGEDVADKDYYICDVCGYPATPEAPERCPICGAPQERFSVVA